MIKLKCTNCGTKHIFNDSELDYECVGSYERSMGVERTYSGSLDFSCDKCDNHIFAEFNFWEYPMLALNYSEYSEEGCIVLEEPNYHNYLTSPENYDYDEEF